MSPFKAEDAISCYRGWPYSLNLVSALDLAMEADSRRLLRSAPPGAKICSGVNDIFSAPRYKHLESG